MTVSAFLQDLRQGASTRYNQAMSRIRHTQSPQPQEQQQQGVASTTAENTVRQESIEKQPWWVCFRDLNDLDDILLFDVSRTLTSIPIYSCNSKIALLFPVILKF